VAVTAAPRAFGAWFATRWGLAAVALLAIAAAVAIGLLYRAGNLAPGSFGMAGSPGSHVAGGIGAKIGQGFNQLETVAGMLAGRSPGERAQGALASLKHKRVPVLHQRALPKVRRSAAPATPLANIVAPPAATVPVVPPVAAPLFNSVTAPPPVVSSLAAAPATIFPGFSPLPGGGFIVPPGVTQVTPPVTPPVTTPQVPPVAAVPEPGSWAMMLLGFVMMAVAIRRRGRETLSSAAL
jgi:hypothetical protein